MRPTHTPGPWRRENNDIRCNETPENCGTFIAEMTSSRSPDETRANARLIAKAPELLEALRAILNADGMLDDAYYEAMQDASEKARALLAEIEGKDGTP